MIDGYVQNDVGTMASCNYIPMIKISVFTLTHFTLSGAFTLTLLKRSQARWGDAPTSTALSLSARPYPFPIRPIIPPTQNIPASTLFLRCPLLCKKPTERSRENHPPEKLGNTRSPGGCNGVTGHRAPFPLCCPKFAHVCQPMYVCLCHQLYPLPDGSKHYIVTHFPQRTVSELYGCRSGRSTVEQTFVCHILIKKYLQHHISSTFLWTTKIV